MLRRHCLLFVVLPCVLLGVACGSFPPIGSRPNIILLVGDDHGYPDYGFLGSEQVETPHLDRLAREGTLFTQGFNSASSCRPSLYTLLTGLHPEQWRARAPRGALSYFPGVRQVETLPRLLGERGYRSFQAGKYWEGLPGEAGFSRGTKAPADLQTLRRRGFGKLANLAGGLGLDFGRESLQPLWDFLDEGDAGEPFFVWFAPLLPHAPFDAPAELLARYRDAPLDPQARRYYANITRFDERVGELLAELERRGLRDDTLLVYLSDNGWEQPPDRPTPAGGGLKGKGSLYELGFHTPLLFSWPGRIAQGVVRHELVATADLFPTLLDLARVRAPQRADAHSLAAALGGAEPPVRERVIGGVELLKDETRRWQGSRGYFLRTSQWRYLWFVDEDREELYQIEADPEERHDLSDRHPELVRAFREQVERWRRELAAAPYSM